MSLLNLPYGGHLIDLEVPKYAHADLIDCAEQMHSIQISERELCDLELLATGAFSPLNSFMNRLEYQSVLDDLRLPNGSIFPIPITLSTDDENIKENQEIVLRDAKNNIIALLKVEEIYEWNREEYAIKVLGKFDSRHPLVAELGRWGKYNLSGNLRVLQLPKRFDFQHLRLTPKQTREKLTQLNASAVVAFQTRNPLHRAHEAMVRRAMDEINGVLLLHPAVGITKPGDVDYYTRIRTYQALFKDNFSPDKVMLSLLPVAMRFAGPREAVWHALIRKNYGASHFIVGRDHASPGINSNGSPFYPPLAAQELAGNYADELGIKILKYNEFVYLPELDKYEEIIKVEPHMQVLTLSGTQVREDYLKKGIPLPEWFTHKEVAKILIEDSSIHHTQGVCLWFTGLSGAGKSTIAEILAALLPEKGRRVTLLDGDIVRTNLSKGLGFSPEDRDTNIRRIGYVASEIVKHGGVAICAAISPYRATRDEIRNLVGSHRFIEIYVETPLEICEERDVKGMYAQARKGIIRDFTGINAPYEEPLNPEIKLNTVHSQPMENALVILEHLEKQGFIRE